MQVNWGNKDILGMLTIVILVASVAPPDNYTESYSFAKNVHIWEQHQRVYFSVCIELIYTKHLSQYLTHRQGERDYQ